MQSLQSFFVSCSVKFMKFFCVLPSKFTKILCCCFLLCKACGAFLFLVVLSSQNFSLSCHVGFEDFAELHQFSNLPFELICACMFCFLFLISFSCLSFRKIAQLFSNTFLYLELRYTLWEI